MKRKPVIEPKQRKISVQDVRDVTTPQGVAMLNDELKRIQLGLEETKKEEKVTTPAAVNLITEEPKAKKKKEDTDKPPTEWALTVRGNSILVPPSKLVQVLNFIDTDTVSFTLRNKRAGSNDTTVENGRVVEIKATATSTTTQSEYDDCALRTEDDLFNYEEKIGTEVTAEEVNKSLVYEYIQHEDYAVSGGVESVMTLEELSNRQPQFNDFLAYPRSNNGDGWIPVRADTKLFSNLDDVIIKPFIYEDPSIGGTSRNAFIFKANTAGVYRVKAKVFLRILPVKTSYTFAPMPYDSIDKGMLIIEKEDAGKLGLSPRNPITDYVNPIDYIHSILDMESRIGNQNSSRNMAQFNSDLDNDGSASQDYMVPSTAYPNPYYVVGGAIGAPYGELFSREMLLNGSVDIYLEKDEGIMLWYKIYTRRIEFNTDYYSDSYASRSGANQATYPSDSICYIEDRVEDVSINYLRAEEVVATKSSVKNIVDKF